jgi:lambda family phage tail tape measure protein
MNDSKIGIVISAKDETKAAFDSVNRSIDDFSIGTQKMQQATSGAFSGLSGQTKYAIQNASYQISDFFVQVNGGTDAARALGQQLPQLLAAFGAFGAVAGIVATFSPQIISFFKSADQVKPLADAMKDASTALADVTSAAKKFDMKPVFEQFNESGKAARSNIVSLLEYRKALAEVTTSLAESSLSKQLKDMSSFGTLDKIIGGDRAVVMAKDLGVELSVAKDLMADSRSGVLESTLLADKYALALSKGSAKGRELAATLVSAAKGSSDAAAAQTAISDAMEKMRKAGDTGKVPIKDDKSPDPHTNDYSQLITSLNEKIAVQTADLMSVEKLSSAEKDYAKYQADLASGATVLTSAQKAVAESFFQVYLARNKANDAEKANKTADTIVGDYARSNAQTLERIQRESELALMTDRQRTIAQALYRTEDEGAAIRARIIHDVQDETAQKLALGKAEEELATQKSKVSDATARAFDEQRSFQFGWTKAFQAYADGATNAASSAADIFQKTTGAMEDALVNLAMTGKMSFTNLANSIIADIIRMQAKAAVSGIMSYVTQILGAYFGSTASSSYGPSSTAGGGSWLGSSQSLNISGGRASGGSVGAGQTYLVGEQGPELLRMGNSSGTIIPNNALSGGGEVTVNVINNSGGDTKTQQRSDGKGNKIIDVFIEQAKNAIAADIANGSGAVPAAMTGAYGLNRNAGAY